MNEIELEFLTACGNCYNACHEDFERTMEMISRWRGYTPEEAKEILTHVKEQYQDDEEYIKLRKRFPEEFPV